MEYEYIHFVVIAKFDERAIAYHFAAKDPDTVLAHKSVLNEQTRVPGYLYGIHLLKTARPDFQAVQERDPYFNDFEVFEDLDEFLDVVYQLALQANAL